MANSKMLNALNDQIKFEYYSGYMYLSMSAYFSDLGLSGFAHWMRVQADEELLHAHKFYDYVIARGGKVTLQAIDAPPSKWKSPLDVFEEGLKHERFVTGRINMLMDTAVTAKDHASHVFLQWFITEQVEEEENFGDLVNKLKLIKGDGQGLLLLDRDLAARAAASAAPAAE
jgi:ferritin